MIRYLLRSAGARLGRAKTLYLLAVFGVALGVAAVLSIQILNRTAMATFWGSVEAVSGEADLSVVGRTPVFPESLYADVLGTAGVDRAWPLFRVSVGVAEQDDVFLEVIGIDLFQPTAIPLDRSAPGDLRAPGTRGWVAVTPTLAGKLSWQVGDGVAVTSGSRQQTLVIGTFVDFQRLTPFASSKLAVMDIAEAQALFGEPGMISQIDVRVAPNADPERVARRLTDRLGPGVGVLTPQEQRDRTAGLVAAFRLNLTALSLISVFVGLFLVFGSTQASLIRRREEIGVLRALGATRGQLLVVLLADVAVLGALGVGIGIPLGYWAARANVGTVSATLTNLYLLREIENVSVPTSLLLLAVATGLGGALAGALPPALDMARRDPHSLLSAYTLHEKIRSSAGRLAAGGALVLVTGGVWYVLWGRAWQPAGFVLAVSLLIGLPMLTPLVVRAVSGPVRARDFGWRYSLRSLAARLQSSAVAIASLAVAVSTLVGITIMIGSFRRTVEVWIAATVRADVYVTSETWARSAQLSPLDSELVAQLERFDGVAAVDRLRGFLGYTGERRISIFGVDMQTEFAGNRFILLDGDPQAALRAVRQSGAVVISEPLARKTGRWTGDSLSVSGPDGPMMLPIAGVRYEYGNEAGSVLMDLETLERRFGPGAINSLALYLDPGTDPDDVVDRLAAAYRDVPLVIRSNRFLRQEVLRIFDQTFAITRILQAMCLLIAASGITLTLLILARERVSELALYRALGAARRQIFTIFVGKGFFMGAIGIVLGAGGGVALAMILIFIVNRAYFGWTVQVSWPFRTLFEQAVTILAAAALASVYPALRASRIPATELSRDDV